MGRRELAKGVHTSPQKAGKKNMENINVPKDELGLMEKIMPIYDIGNINKKAYKGLWTEEEFIDCIDKFFQYCREQDFKPTKPALQVWLGVSRDTYNEWERFPDKYSYKSDKVRQANQIMEIYLQGQVDKYPTGSIFLLKASHGLADSTTVNINTNVSQEDVGELVSKLGLDK